MHLFFYESFESASVTEARNAFKTAETMLLKLKEMIGKMSKQHTFTF
jgi:hypothetical protein